MENVLYAPSHTFLITRKTSSCFHVAAADQTPLVCAVGSFEDSFSIAYRARYFAGDALSLMQMRLYEFKQLLEKLGWMQREMAQYLQVSESVLSKAMASEETWDRFVQRYHADQRLEMLNRAEVRFIVERNNIVDRIARCLTRELPMDEPTAIFTASRLVDEWYAQSLDPNPYLAYAS